MVLDFCIVGGGLSGLYRAYKLSKKYPKAKIHLYQDSDRLGGRIYTHTLENGTQVDMGAGRIATHHPLTMKLIKELGLTKQLIPLSNIPKSLESLQHFETEEEALTFLSRLVKTAIHKIPKRYLSSMSFMTACKLFFHKKMQKIKEAIHVCGYDTELEIGNAWVLCHSILDMFDPNLKFASLKGGLSTIINGLLEKLQKKKNVRLHSSHVVTGWRKLEDNPEIWEVLWKNRNDTSQTTNVTSTKHLHIATGVSAWKRWFEQSSISHVPIDMQTYIDSVLPISLCRVYATFDESSRWIECIRKCTTKTPLRYIIPITTNTIMISYLDGEKADELSTMDDNELRDWVVNGIQQAFPGFSRFIPEPTEIKRGYWKVGVHVWGPMKHHSAPASFPSSDPTFTMSGEAFSQLHQGWMEGALQCHTDPKKHLSIQ